MPLFGDGGDVTTLTVAMALMASLGSFGSAYLTYCSTRDRLVYDADHVKMKADIRACEDDRDEQRLRITELEGRLDRREAREAN